MREDILNFLPTNYIQDHKWEVIYDEKARSTEPDRYKTGFRCTECQMEIDADFVGKVIDNCDFWIPASSIRGVYDSINYCSCAEIMLKHALE